MEVLKDALVLKTLCNSQMPIKDLHKMLLGIKEVTPQMDVKTLYKNALESYNLEIPDWLKDVE